MADGPSLTEKFKTPPPFYVRKVDRRGHWGDAEKIVEHVFPVDVDGTISVYHVDSDATLERIAVALNANRVATNPAGSSLTEQILFVAIREDEFGAIPLKQIDGLTDCEYVNKRHYGALVPEGSETKRERLVNALLTDGRQPSKLSKGVMRQAVEQAMEDHCKAVDPGSAGCDFC